jgi:hypothetical protein
MPWANDGGGAWNAAKCTPIADDPAQAGEPCHMEGSVYSGVDDCDLGAVCFDVDLETLEGICRPLCSGSNGYLTCDDPNYQCSVSSDARIPLCVPICNSFTQDCPEVKPAIRLRPAGTADPLARGFMATPVNTPTTALLGSFAWIASPCHLDSRARARWGAARNCVISATPLATCSAQVRWVDRYASPGTRKERPQ